MSRAIVPFAVLLCFSRVAAQLDVISYDLAVVLRGTDLAVATTIEATGKVPAQWRLELAPQMKVLAAEASGKAVPFTVGRSRAAGVSTSIVPGRGSIPRAHFQARWYSCNCEFPPVIPSPMVSKHIIRAVEFCQPDEGPVDSARRIAREALSALGGAQTVAIAMDGVRGASSSFFNVIFSELAAALGAAAVRQRVEFTGLGKTQALIAVRSRAAVLGT